MVVWLVRIDDIEGDCDWVCVELFVVMLIEELLSWIECVVVVVDCGGV